MGMMGKLKEARENAEEVKKRLDTVFVTGESPDGQLVEFIELRSHPYWVATQAHPEFKSRPNRPAPLFASFIEAVVERKNGRNPKILTDDAVTSSQ